MTVLAQEELEKRLFGAEFREEPDEQLIITPLLDRGNQIGNSSIDVRLGNAFIIIKQSNLSCINPALGVEIEEKIGQYQEYVHVSFGDEFVIHPQQLILGCTLEYVGLPQTLTAQVLGRSSWGRLGLFIATATAVAPGFKGVITLELINAGQVPIVLYPGVVIAQLVIEKTSSKTKYEGRYDFPTSPQFSRIYKDEDIVWWSNRENFNV
ncbi:dCTP deaminase [Acidobacteriota bacterium]